MGLSAETAPSLSSALNISVVTYPANQHLHGISDVSPPGKKPPERPDMK